VARTYQLKKRAERQEETRRRIVEAAVAIHGEVGPAGATVSAIAERAGVERHTYYRHFPDERSLHLACSAHFYELNPLPDPEPWRSVTDPEARLRRALGELYGYYADHEPLITNVLRDLPVHPLTAEIAALRLLPRLEAMREALTEGLVAGRNRRRVLASLDVALSFHTWQTLVRMGGLSKGEAAKLMARAVACATAAG
jgi:AcrR family transcriptional regulator